MPQITGRALQSQRALLTASVAVLSACAAVPAAAFAGDGASVRRDGATLVVTGTPARDEIALMWSPGPVITVLDAYKTVLSDGSCTVDGSGVAQCPADGLQAVEVHLGDGDDSLLTKGGIPVHAYGEGGNDTLYAGDAPGLATPAAVLFDGGPGDDRLAGSPLGDTLLGGPGDDGIEGGPGDDTINPGPGRDAVTDLTGANAIDTRDGEPDSVSCAAGTSILLDPVDSAPGCAPGPAMSAAALDCTPEIGPTTSTSLRRLRRVRTIALRVTASPGCSVHASIAWRRQVIARATAAQRTSRLVLRLSRAAVRRVRPGHLVVTITSGAAGARSVRRTVTVRVTR